MVVIKIGGQDMATYLVDYENVHHSGLLGIEALSEEDNIVVFYSDNGETIPIYLLDNCSASYILFVEQNGWH